MGSADDGLREARCTLATQPDGTIPRPTRTRDPGRKEKILNAAADLIASHGYVSVKLSDIGQAAGIVGSGIYRHFDSKVAILVEMFDRVVDRLIAEAEVSLRESDDPRATLVSLVRDQVLFTIEERTLCKVYVEEARNLPPGDYRRLRWKQRHYVDLWQDVLRAVRPDLSGPQAQTLVHASIAVIQSVLRYRTEFDGDELGEMLTVMACRVLEV